MASRTYMMLDVGENFALAPDLDFNINEALSEISSSPCKTLELVTSVLSSLQRQRDAQITRPRLEPQSILDGRSGRTLASGSDGCYCRIICLRKGCSQLPRNFGLHLLPEALLRLIVSIQRVLEESRDPSERLSAKVCLRRAWSTIYLVCQSLQGSTSTLRSGTGSLGTRLYSGQRLLFCCRGGPVQRLTMQHLHLDQSRLQLPQGSLPDVL
mmetsp:Transcript_54481/g.100299  ORF Transcript_54481/g.100299 Transcript_54481/m.100299 type:complete len:212 (-) Transcript_54481:347-982(-)